MCRCSGWTSAPRPTRQQDPNAPQVILITKQYDGAGDWPKYVLVNPLAAANAAMGFIYVHNGYYQDVTFDPKAYDVNNNGKLDRVRLTP